MRISVSLAAFAVLMLPACASIVAGGPDIVPVTSSPEGATVSLDGGVLGSTPLEVTFEREGEGILTFDSATRTESHD